MSRVDCFHSFIKGERKRDHHQFLFGAFIFAPSKAKKKAKNGRTAVALVASERCHIHTIDYTIISRYRYRARRRDRAFHASPSKSHDARTAFAECRPSFWVGRLRVDTVRKAFSFPRCFSRSKDGIPIQSALMMTQKCAHRIPLFFGRRDRRDRRATRKNDATPFHARYTRVVRGKKGKRKSAAYHCFVLACEASK